MTTPQIISAFLGDTLSLRLSVFDGSGLPFNDTSWGIDTVSLIIPALDATVSGTISAGIVTVIVPADTIGAAGSYSYYIQLSNSTDGYVFTVLHGTLNITDLPQ